MRAYNANTPHKQTNAESTFFAHAPGQRGLRCYLPPPSLMHNKLAQSERAICDNNKIYITPSSWTRDFVKCAHNVYRAMIHNVSTGADCDGDGSDKINLYVVGQIINQIYSGARKASNLCNAL
jgi:hypothetical protein